MKRGFLFVVVGILSCFLVAGFLTVVAQSDKPAAGEAPKTADASGTTTAVVTPPPVTATTEVIPAAPPAGDAKPAATEVVAAPPPSTNTGDSVMVELPKEDKGTDPIKGVSVATTSNKVEESNFIDLTFDDAQLADVVKMFGRISQANIIANASNLTGRVTAQLQGVEWKPALESILDMHNLSLQEKVPGSRVYMIVPKIPGQAEPMVTDTIFLKYAAVTNVQSVLVAMVTPNRGTVSTFPSRNAIVVRTTSSNMDEVKRILEKIDRFRDQVFIEAKFLELSESASKQVGIRWDSLRQYNMSVQRPFQALSDSKTTTKSRTDSQDEWSKKRNTETWGAAYDENLEYNSAGTVAQPLSGSLTPEAPSTMPSLGYTKSDSLDSGKDITKSIQNTFSRDISDVKSAVLSAADFNLVLSALKDINGAAIISNPKLIVANEETAAIHIGQIEKPFLPQVTPGQQGQANTVIYNLGPDIKYGVELNVTPTVNTHSNITVKIEPTLTRFVQDKYAPDGLTYYPVVSSKKITTVFCLESGKTVAIGGLTQTDDNKTVTKIPLLGSLPLIGWFFSHTSDVKRQIETIIFVTVGVADPDVIQPDDGLPENTELAQRKLLNEKVRRAKYVVERRELTDSVDRQLQKINKNNGSGKTQPK